MKLGKNIKKYRKKKKLTQKELGDIIKRSEVSIRKYEAGDVSPNLDLLNEIADALNTTINELLGIPEPNKKEFYFNIDKVADYSYNIFREIYNHSKIKDQLGLTAEELIMKDKYLIEELVNTIKDLTFTKIKATKRKIVNRDNIPASESIKIKYGYETTKEDENGGKYTYVAPTVDLSNKLNDKEYLEYKINEYKKYLENVENEEDNYRIENEGLEEAKKTSGEEAKEEPRPATQKDIDKLFN